MPTVQIRNLDESAYAELRRRAAASGRSLQEFLRITLEREAAQPCVDEALETAQVDLAWDDEPDMADIVEAQRANRRR